MTRGLPGRLLQVWQRYNSTPRQAVRAFTIIEVLIVMAVTGIIFASTVILISGRQQRTQFEQSVRDIQSQIQQVINDVETGFYPNRGTFTCTAGGGGPIFSSVSASQGSNEGCVFLGKAVQFKVGTTNPEQLKIYTVAGLQKNASGGEATSYAQAMPKVVSPSTSQPSVPDKAVTSTLLYGLTTSEAYYGAVKTNIGSIAFLASLNYSGSSGILSGSQQLNLVPIDGSALGVSQQQAAETINVQLPTTTVNPSTGISICFVSGGTNQSALMKIGGSGRQLSVKLDVKSNTTCG